MRIISCHIENFGILHDFSCEFSDDITSVCKDNGCGKSTLAAFIRSMFFGLAGERRRSIGENERKRFRPWQGGSFGGYLVFETGDKRYKVTRIFHAKESQDEFELRDVATNLVSQDYSSNLGEELFGVNRDSYMRTVFLDQNDCMTSVTDDINAKIGNLLDDTSDMNRFETAISRLTTQINQLNPSRSTGRINQRESQITALSEKVRAGDSIPRSLELYEKKLSGEQDQYNDLKKKQKDYIALQEKVSSQQMRISKKDELERLQKKYRQRREEVRSRRAVFRGEIPELEDIDLMIGNYSDLKEEESRMSVFRLSVEETDELREYAEVFERDLPSEEQIQQQISRQSELQRQKSQLTAEQMTDQERERLSLLEKTFSNDTESVNDISVRWNTRNSRAETLSALKLMDEAMDKRTEGHHRRFIGTDWMMDTGIFLMILGLIVTVFVSLIPGAVLCIAGVALFVSRLFPRIKSKSVDSLKDSTESLSDLKQSIEGSETFIRDTDLLVKEYIHNHGYDFEESKVSSYLQMISEDYLEYNTLKNKEKLSVGDYSAMKIHQEERKIQDFLDRFGMDHVDEVHLLDALYFLRDSLISYHKLTEKKTSFERSRKNFNQIYSILISYLSEYRFEVTANLQRQLFMIRDYVNEYYDALQLEKEACKELTDFEKEYGNVLAEAAEAEETYPAPDKITETLQTTGNALENCFNVMNEYRNILSHLREQFDEWEEAKKQLSELKEVQEQDRIRYTHLLKAREYLTKAKESLTSRYSGPIQKSFSHYYEMITKQAASDYYIDANANVTKEECGKQRQLDTLSTGYQDLIGILLRIALVDAMYKEESPLLIMDDPFVNLDDEKTRAGCALLREISRKYQIIYFTCSHSRLC